MAPIRRYAPLLAHTLPFPGALVGLYMQAYITKKANHTVSLFNLISDFLSSQAVSSQVLSAFTSLTTVFEMGTGGPS